MKRPPILIIAAIVLVVCAVALYFTHAGFRERIKGRPSPPAANTVTYFCREGLIRATYLTNKVRLVLPDGRKFELPQAVAGSGIRFTDGNLEFWSKGANARVTENNQVIYSDGVAGTVSHPAKGTAEFTDSSKTFSFRFPRNLILSGKDIGFTQGWRAGASDYGMVLALVTIPRQFATRTNFSGAEFSIGQSSDPEAVNNCFVEPRGYGVQTEQVKLAGVSFTKYTFSDAGAGNLYETTSYRTKRGDGCYVVEYTIHSTNIGNYPPDQGIKEFDKGRVIEVLEGMVRGFRFL